MASASGCRPCRRPGCFLNDSRRGVRTVRRQQSANEEKRNMPLYEHIFLARQDLAQAQVDALAENATKILTDNGGTVVKTETWGLRSLAYRIAKNRKAHYVLLDIDARLPRSPTRAPDHINDDLIRFMTTRVMSIASRRQMPAAKDRDDRVDGRRPDRAPRGRPDRPTAATARATVPRDEEW